MLATIKAEFRKLLTVRSTYGLVAFSLGVTALFAGWIQGYNMTQPALNNNAGLLASQSTSAIVFVGFILAFAGLLLAGNEYRFTTIMYTLTSANRRYKVLLAKLFVITVFAIATSLLVMFFSPLCTIVGVHLAGHHLSPQTYPLWSLVWKCLFTGWGYAMYAFILIMIMRNQIGAIIAFLLFPLIGENILMLLLKKNAQYLPFTALQSVAEPTALGNHTTSGHQAVVVLVYVAIGLVVSAVLFWRRDAN